MNDYDGHDSGWVVRTDGDGPDLNALLVVSAVGIVRLLVVQDALSAESVDEGGPAWGSQRVSQWLRRGMKWEGMNAPVPEAPQTIRQNWMPFLTFFFLRIIFCFVGQ
jgi:hypothetical protein